MRTSDSSFLVPWKRIVFWGGVGRWLLQGFWKLKDEVFTALLDGNPTGRIDLGKGTPGGVVENHHQHQHHRL